MAAARTSRARRTARVASDADARILVRSEHPAGAAATRALRKLAAEFLSDRKHFPAGAELSIVLTTDRAIRQLNREWRGKDKATDVLSFEQDPAQGLLGDVVISLDTARRQADEGDRPLADELARLLAHGLLHLLGHDHENATDARKMARAEIALLGTIGMVADAFGTPAELEFHRVTPPPKKKPAAKKNPAAKKKPAANKKPAARKPAAKKPSPKRSAR